jgi:hypothetical protein
MRWCQEPERRTLGRRPASSRDLSTAVLPDPERVKYESNEDGLVHAKPQRRCNLAVDATSTKRDGRARRGVRNHGLTVVVLLPHDRKVRSFVLHFNESEVSKWTARSRGL